MYKSFLAAPSLREFVRNYTLIEFQFNNHESRPLKQRPPKPEQKIVFYIKGAPNIRNHASGNIQTPPPVSIYSHQREKTTIQLTSEFSAFIIFLQPGVLHRLIQLPMLELPQGSFDAELFFGTEVRVVLDQLASADSPSSMISIVEQFLFAKCKQLKLKSSIDTIADYLLVDPTHFSLDALAIQACLSSKQFYRRSTERIGMSPKLYSRLSRFTHAHRYKITHPYSSWSSIAQEFCYTDYHHMEKEFKEFAGHTPQEWINIELAAPERILRLR
jgi:AraC-like DNA-binding protein